MLSSEALTLIAHALIIFILIISLRQLRRWPLMFALLTLPGTIAHELLHFIAGLLTGARPVGLSVIPKQQPDGSWHLGVVTFANLRWWNSVPVGLAPLALILLGGWLFFYSATLPLISTQGALLKIVTALCLISGWPSQEDWSHAIKGLLIIVILAAAIALVMISTGWVKI